MIETIYSNDNRENDKSGKVIPSVKMPKNIRQVGKSNAGKKIYIEDYAMTYIRQLAGGDYSECSLAVLVGQCTKQDNCRSIFISGAVKVMDPEVYNEFVFTNETWSGIYEEIKKYFIDMEIVGWFIGGPGYLLTDDDKILKTHIDNFAGQDKVLLTYDNIEKEEAFLCYENSRLCKQEGYYIYYEKNEEMQNYIIDHKQPESCESGYDDRVSRNIRAVIQNKQAEKEDSKSVNRLMYVAGTLLAVVVLIIGAALLRNYDQMKNMQATLNYLSEDMQEVQGIFAQDGVTGEPDTSEDISQEDQAMATQGAKEDSSKSDEDSTKSDEDSSLDVEVLPGNVKPLAEDADNNEDSGNKDQNDTGTATDKELADQQDKDDSSRADSNNSAKAEDNTKGAKVETSYYVVREGDTLADISFHLYNTYTKVKKIMQLNGIEDQNLIYVGQKLIVP